MAHKHQGYRFENDWEMEVLESDSKSLAAGVTLPVYEEIKAEHTVLNLDSVKKILEKSPKIAVAKCACRDKRKHCDAPVEVCLELNDMAVKDLASAREVRIRLLRCTKITHANKNLSWPIRG